MKSQPRSFTATRALLSIAGALLACAAAAAPPAGTVVQADGPLLAQKADGRTRVIAKGAAVDVGDTIVTGGGTYAEIRFADRSDAILEPDTQLKIDAFSVAEDAARWTLAQGGMQVTSGDIASHGAARHSIATPLGTIAVGRARFFVTVTAPLATPAAAHAAATGRVYLAQNSVGTMSDAAPIFVAQALPTGIVAPPGGKPPTTPPALAPGLHLQVLDGAIVVTNHGGSQGFQAGQFGYVPSVNQPPVIVPSNPGIQFTPPPAFNSGSGGPTGGKGSGGANAVDCEVR